MELFYREYGDGPPLVLLHGLFGMSDNWVTMARRLAEEFHVYLPDQRNHGQSPHSGHHSYLAMAEDLEEFLNTHDIENPIVMGHSMGGKVAMLFATEEPSRVKKLIVVDICPKTYDRHDQHLEMLEVMMDADLSSMKTRLQVESYVASRISDNRIRLFILKNLYRSATDHFAWRPNLQAIYDNLDQMVSETPLTFQYNKPALFVRGALSDYITDLDIPKIKTIFSAVELVTIENAGHWVHVDAPEELYTTIIEFAG